MGVEIVFEDKIHEVMERVSTIAEKRMMEAVFEVRNAVLENLAGQRSYRQYRVPGTKRLYWASAPGEYPAVATASLRKSIKGGIEKEGKDVLGFVGTEEKHGAMLEFGTRKMAARPWLRRTFEQSQDKVKEIFTRLWF